MEPFPRESAIQQLRLRFFDLEANIRSDSSAIIDLFAQMYRRFQVDVAPSPVRPPIEFAVLTQPDNPWAKLAIVLDGEVRFLNDPRLLEGYVYESILHTIVARVRSHFLIHAGVVSCGGQGIILAADAHHGKTTLVLELLRRGFKFLSDEMAALGRADRRVHPFPRSLRIRPGTLELAGFPEAAVGAPTWLGKLLLDIEEIRPDSMGEAAAISQVIILQNPAGKAAERPDGPERELGVLVDRLDEGFLAAIRQIKGVSDVRTGLDRGYPLIRLRAIRRTSVLSRIETLCRERGILVLDIIKRTEGQPSFKSPARLEAISRSQAVMELLRRFQGGHKSALLQEEFGGSSTRLFIELAEVVSQAHCTRLSVGPLDEMADLVCGLVGI